jgi:hypothetical protein
MQSQRHMSCFNRMYSCIGAMLFSKGTIETQLSTSESSESSYLREKKLSATMRVTVGLLGE